MPELRERWRATVSLILLTGLLTSCGCDKASKQGSEDKMAPASSAQKIVPIKLKASIHPALPLARRQAADKPGPARDALGDQDPDDSEHPRERNDHAASGEFDRFKEKGARKPPKSTAPAKGKKYRRSSRPRYLPRSFYFENTYLGGNAAVDERLRRLDAAWGEADRPYRLAGLGPQAFDPPASQGMALHVSLDRASLERPGRVLLQIGLKGSQRYGWRRPPLDVMLVIDPPALLEARKAVIEIVLRLVRRLGPQDRLGILVPASPPRLLARPQRLRKLKLRLADHLERLSTVRASNAASLGATLVRAGQLLGQGDGGGIPGTKTVLLVTGAPDSARVRAASQAAHRLALQGVVSSVLQTGASPGRGWWTVAHRGQGNYHRLAGSTVAAVIDAELGSLSRVVARLLRLNITLGSHVRAVRILGSRKLDRAEVRQLKQREQATDRRLSRSLGVASDRGADDDGIQTVIPYFYGSDAHLILIELQVDRPGLVAEISLRYKDMVRLTNAQLHASARLSASPRKQTPMQREVARNSARFRIARHLWRAAYSLERGDRQRALSLLRQSASASASRDRQMLETFQRQLSQTDLSSRQLLIEALRLAARRMVGHSQNSRSGSTPD